tara:strand:- start:350 stop:1060 length:711 start_codon:yes stop_codon:yes gene_type:complete
MKTFLSYFLFILPYFIYSQNFQSDQRVWNETTQRAFRDLGRLKTSKPTINQVEGSIYFESKFKEGNIVHLDKEIDIKTKLRYNAFNDEIELIDNSNGSESIKVAIKNFDIISYFDNKEFIFMSYLDSNKQNKEGYLNPIYKGSRVNIYEKKRKKFLKGKESVNSLDIAHPPRYTDEIEYYISFNESKPSFVKLSKKSILNTFNKSNDIKSFYSKNRLNLREISSLIEIAKYYEQNN